MDRLAVSKGLKVVAKSLIAASKPTIEVAGKSGLDAKEISIRYTDYLPISGLAKKKGKLYVLKNDLSLSLDLVKKYNDLTDSYVNEVIKELKTFDDVKGYDVFVKTDENDYEASELHVTITKQITLNTGKDKKEVFEILKNKFGARFDVVLK